MASKQFKVSFTLDEQDANYFRNLFRTARKHVSIEKQPDIIKDVQELIEKVKQTKRVPSFVVEATRTLEDLIQMLEDKDYDVPKAVAVEALGGLGYFADPEDVIPDHIPALGFLDDAIMMKFVEEEFKHELWGYRKFRTFRAGAEQRPWTKVASDRLPKRLGEYRESIRLQIKRKKEADSAKQKKAQASGRRSGW
jgi:uncharacterized membrane protein YkvA (DUF1232 family)